MGMQVSANANPTPGTAATTSTGTATFAAALVTLGLATTSWVLAVRPMDGMDMGVATSLGSFAFFVALWVTMLAAMTLPGAVPAVWRRAHASGRVPAVPLFLGCISPSGLSWALRSMRCTGHTASSAAGAVAIVAGIYEFTPLQQHFRRRCRESVRSGFEFGLYCVGPKYSADAGSARRHERHLDVRDRCRHPRPEDPARECGRRCAAGASDRRTWNPDRHRAVVGSRTHATDVSRHPLAPGHHAQLFNKRRRKGESE